MVLTVRRALPATSELGTPTPNVFSMLTTSSRASIESSPSPFGPKRGKSSPIWSGVVCSIKFLTSISLMRGRRSTSDINEAREIVVNGGAGQLYLSLRWIGRFAGDAKNGAFRRVEIISSKGLLDPPLPKPAWFG